MHKQMSKSSEREYLWNAFVNLPRSISRFAAMKSTRTWNFKSSYLKYENVNMSLARLDYKCLMSFVTRTGMSDKTTTEVS